MRKLLCLLPLLALLGCAEDGQVVAHPVSGQVLYDGKPAEGVKVFFVPTSAPMPPEIPANPHAVTDRDGRFRLSTFGDGDGAAEGGYQVLLLWEDESSPDERKPDRLMGWFDGVHSRLTAQVKAGNNELPAFSLPVVKGPPPKSEGVPGRN